MFAELLWVHAVIRRQLETVERLAADVGDGLADEAVQARLEDLKKTTPARRCAASIASCDRDRYLLAK